MINQGYSWNQFSSRVSGGRNNWYTFILYSMFILHVHLYIYVKLYTIDVMLGQTSAPYFLYCKNKTIAPGNQTSLRQLYNLKLIL